MLVDHDMLVDDHMAVLSTGNRARGHMNVGRSMVITRRGPTMSPLMAPRRALMASPRLMARMRARLRRATDANFDADSAAHIDLRRGGGSHEEEEQYCQNGRCFEGVHHRSPKKWFKYKCLTCILIP